MGRNITGRWKDGPSPHSKFALLFGWKGREAPYKRHDKKQEAIYAFGSWIRFNWEFAMRNMLKSGSGGEKESRTISVGDFKQQEDLEMYGQLPDYDEFQLYVLGIDTDLSKIGEKMYASFHRGGL